jgi:hypothetical protein
VDGDDGASRQAILAGGWVPVSFTTGERRGQAGRHGRKVPIVN